MVLLSEIFLLYLFNLFFLGVHINASNISGYKFNQSIVHLQSEYSCSDVIECNDVLVSSKNENRYPGSRSYFLKTRKDFDGLGIHISCDPKSGKSPFIYKIEPGSPAKLAGLLKNDYILEINGQYAANFDFHYCVDLLKELTLKNNIFLVVKNKKAF